MRHPFRLALSLVLLAVPAVARADEWTDVSGSKTIEAEFLGVWDGKAVLQRPDGRRAAVPLRMLNAESRLKAQRLQEELEQRRAERLETYREEAEEAAAAAAAAEAAAPDAPYEPLPEDAGLEETADHLAAQLAAGHPQILWDALPPSYRDDLNDLVHRFATRIDPRLWTQVVATVEKLNRLLAEKKSFVLGHPAFEQLPPPVSDMVAQAYEPVRGLVAEILDPDMLAQSNLQEIDLGAVVAEKGPRIGGHLRHLQQLTGMDVTTVAPGWQVVEEGDQEGVVTTPGPEGPTPARFVKVEGRWVPEEMADGWAEQIEQAQAAIDNLGKGGESDPSAQAQMGVFMVQGVLDQLLEAESQEEFNQVLSSVLPDLQLPAGLPLPGGGGAAEFGDAEFGDGADPSPQP